MATAFAHQRYLLLGLLRLLPGLLLTGALAALAIWAGDIFPGWRDWGWGR